MLQSRDVMLLFSDIDAPELFRENVPHEKLFGHLKKQALRQIKIPTYEEAKQVVDEYIHFYNHERIQLKTRQTPYERRCLPC